MYINIKEWEKLPKEYQAILKIACADAHMDMVAKYDARNPVALTEMISTGTQLKQYPKEIMEASYKAAQEVYAEIMAKNPDFKKIYTDFAKFRDMENGWHRLAEGSFSNFMYNRVGKK